MRAQPKLSSLEAFLTSHGVDHLCKKAQIHNFGQH